MADVGLQLTTSNFQAQHTDTHVALAKQGAKKPKLLQRAPGATNVSSSISPEIGEIDIQAMLNEVEQQSQQYSSDSILDAISNVPNVSNKFGQAFSQLMQSSMKLNQSLVSYANKTEGASEGLKAEIVNFVNSSTELMSKASLDELHQVVKHMIHIITKDMAALKARVSSIQQQEAHHSIWDYIGAALLVVVTVVAAVVTAPETGGLSLLGGVGLVCGLLGAGLTVSLGLYNQYDSDALCSQLIGQISSLQQQVKQLEGSSPSVVLSTVNQMMSQLNEDCANFSTGFTKMNDVASGLAIATSIVGVIGCAGMAGAASSILGITVGVTLTVGMVISSICQIICSVDSILEDHSNASSSSLSSTQNTASTISQWANPMTLIGSIAGKLGANEMTEMILNVVVMLVAMIVMHKVSGVKAVAPMTDSVVDATADVEMQPIQQTAASTARVDVDDSQDKEGSAANSGRDPQQQVEDGAQKIDDDVKEFTEDIEASQISKGIADRLSRFMGELKFNYNNTYLGSDIDSQAFKDFQAKFKFFSTNNVLSHIMRGVNVLNSLSGVMSTNAEQGIYESHVLNSVAGNTMSTIGKQTANAEKSIEASISATMSNEQANIDQSNRLIGTMTTEQKSSVSAVTALAMKYLKNVLDASSSMVK